ncbi:restriction endonuclease subunit S [Lactococcus lactis]|uniref:Restriction endonuclease subunit S n=1 Tax=Lactococcus lactis TaxID=1358 RepID=A0AAW8UAZ3_9LACT|nr:restriction endonuclease subunit S [Lactococcus lactis]MDT2945353.1 restriction endonuclease subunit S [Lactococcus lactis]
MTPEQLKASILQRAMEGKLVSQDPDDEPASELLKRIKAEKEKLIKEGKIKRDKNETEIFRGDDGLHYEKFGDGTVKQVDIPFEIPESWEWVRFSEVSTIVRGGSPRPIREFITEADDGINWIKIGDTNIGGKFINSTKEKIKPTGLKKTRYVTKGTFLLTNSMSFGRPYILNVDGAIHDGWLAISNYEEVFSRDFLYYLLSSKVAYHQFLELISGAVVKNLNSDKVASLLVPVPPKKEQERIVSAVFIGLPKVEDYQKLHDRLEKINKEFPEKLRKSILQYAMQGKLVPQNPNDEPVEVLLEKIRQEKQKLYEEGKLKKKDLEESIIYKGDDNSYYENIPETWVSTTLGNIGVWGAGATPSRSNPKYYGGSIPWLKTGDLTDGYITEIPEYITELALEKTSVKLNPTNSVLIAMYGATIGKLGILTFPVATNQACCACQPIPPVNNWFLFYYLMSIRRHFIDSAEGGAQPNISRIKIVNTPFPMPSYTEQARIVSQVEKSFDLINLLPE